MTPMIREEKQKTENGKIRIHLNLHIKRKKIRWAFHKILFDSDSELETKSFYGYDVSDAGCFMLVMLFATKKAQVNKTHWVVSLK